MSQRRPLLITMIANFGGQGVSAIANFAFIPAYIHLLGIEAYGLIGLFAVVLTAASLLDAGMTPTLNREMASFRAGTRDVIDMRNLLFSVLVLAAAGVVVSGVAGLFASPWLARVWIPTNGLPLVVVERALLLMGIVATLRVIEGMLRGVLLGLQLPVRMNVISSTTVLIRAAGVLIPLTIAPSVTTFFVWQAAVCFGGNVVLALVAFAALTPAKGLPRLDASLLYGQRHFAGGVFLTSLLSLVLAQADKIILVKVTSLQTFGYYSIAVAVAAVLYQAILPISQAYYPHFTMLYGEGRNDSLASSYHQASRLVAVIVSAAASFVFAFASPLLDLWSGKPDVVAHTGPLLQILIIGVAFHCLMYIPYMLQLAAGWSRLAVIVNSALACLYLPLLWLAASRAGPAGAAIAWGCSTFIALIATSLAMHRRLLRGDWGKWLAGDVMPPAIAAALTAALLCRLVPSGLPLIPRLLVLALVGTLILIGSTFASPIGRQAISDRLRARKATL